MAVKALADEEEGGLGSTPPSPAPGRSPPGDGRAKPPDELAIARWRSNAESHLDRVLAEFDQRLLDGAAPSTAARESAQSFMRWTGASLARFVPESGRLRMGSLHAGEARTWARQVDRMATSANRDPGQLEAFLRHWLATVHEAVATGYAAIFAH